MAKDENPNLLKHLEFLQLTIVRMAANSFIIKGWAVTLVAAILAFTTSEKTCKGAWLALIPAIMFWGLDGYFLRQERLFRRLYDNVRKLVGTGGDTDFSMNTSACQKEVDSWIGVCFSKTLLWFYLPLAVVAAGVAYYLK